MTILEFFKTVHPSVLAAKMIFRHLQEHYPVLKISNIADTTSGGTPNRGIPEYYNGDIPWVKSGELKDGLITTCDEYITEAGLKNSSAKLFPKGTLLVAMYGANIGKTGVLDFDASTNQAVCAIFPKVDISREFLYWYFKQQRIDFIAVGKGGAQPNISQTIINNASIVVPDDKVQDTIVKFLERIEKGDGIDYDFFIPEVLKDVETIYKYKNSYVTLSDSFETQLTQLENLNQAILQEAVQGKLVKQDPKDEPASELLKRIASAKLSTGKADKMNGQGVSTRAKKEKPLPPIKPEEIPFEIPENWVWCRLGGICSKIGSGSTPKGSNYSISGFPFFRSQNIYNDSLIYDDIKFISDVVQKQMSGTIVLANDILLNITGGSMGRCALVPEYFEEGNVSQHVCIIRPLELNRNYLHKIVLSPYFQKSIFSSTSGAGREGLPKYNLEQFVIPLPPLPEQKRIVAEIEKQFAKTKQLKEHIIANQQATEQLLKALLHQAFEVRETKEA